MTAISVTGHKPSDVVKRAFFLAWQACGGTFGLGFLQDRPGANEEDVWNNVCTRGDYYGGLTTFGVDRGEAYGDYVFGRMMKLSMSFDDDKGTVSVSSREPNPEYQGWSATYPTYTALVQAAVGSLTLAS